MKKMIVFSLYHQRWAPGARPRSPLISLCTVRDAQKVIVRETRLGGYKYAKRAYKIHFHFRKTERWFGAT